MSSNRSNGKLNIWPAILAWLWPGLGHIVLGHRRRGSLIMAGMLLLIVGGLLIGGIDVVDRRRDRLWFYAQSLCGPLAFAVDFANQNLLNRLPDNWAMSPEWRRGYDDREPEVLDQLATVSIGRANEIGTLYVALAGLMNLVVILDALQLAPYRGPTPTGRRSSDQ